MNKLLIHSERNFDDLLRILTLSFPEFLTFKALDKKYTKKHEAIKSIFYSIGKFANDKPVIGFLTGIKDIIL